MTATILTVIAVGGLLIGILGGVEGIEYIVTHASGTPTERGVNPEAP